MPNPPPLLSIAVPTYQRPERLRELLWGVCNQIDPLPDVLKAQVNCWVFDNASSDHRPDDDTTALVQRYQERFGFLHYRRSEQNQGADANIRRCVSEPDGQFIWLFCDDDLPARDAVIRLLTHLHQIEKARLKGQGPQIDFIHSNAHSRDVSMTIQRHDRLYDGGEQGASILTGEAFARRFHVGLIRASSNIYRKSALFDGNFDANFDEKTPKMTPFLERFLEGHLCSPLVLALQCLGSASNQPPRYGSYLDDPLLIYRENQRPWEALVPLISIYAMPLMAWQAARWGLFSKTFHRVFLWANPDLLRRWILQLRTQPRPTITTEPTPQAPIHWGQFIRLYWHHPGFWRESLWCCLLPRPLLQSLAGLLGVKPLPSGGIL
jgi:glycosyltransferase involved in cell wall biosynthesis